MGEGTWEDSTKGVVLVIVPNVVPTVLLIVLAALLVVAVLHTANIVVILAVLGPLGCCPCCRPRPRPCRCPLSLGIIFPDARPLRFLSAYEEAIIDLGRENKGSTGTD